MRSKVVASAIRSAILGGILAAGVGSAGADQTQLANPAPVRDWSGLHIGGSAGGFWGEQSGDFVTGPTQAVNGFSAVPAAAPISLDGVSRGAAAGLGLGYNFQHGPFVFGIEGELSAIGFNANVTAGPGTPGFRTGGIKPQYAYFKQTANGFAAIQGRLGYTFGNMLLSVSGGPAFARANLQSYFPGDNAVSTSFPDGFPNASASRSVTLPGFVVGSEVDFSISDRWSLGLAYEHVGFANGDFAMGQRAVQGRSTQMGFLPPVVSFNYAPQSAKSGFQGDLALLKLSYYLNGR